MILAIQDTRRCLMKGLKGWIPLWIYGDVSGKWWIIDICLPSQFHSTFNSSFRTVMSQERVERRYEICLWSIDILTHLIPYSKTEMSLSAFWRDVSGRRWNVLSKISIGFFFSTVHCDWITHQLRRSGLRCLGKVLTDVLWNHSSSISIMG